MNTIYLIRHSTKDKAFIDFNKNYTKQEKNEKIPLNEEGRIRAEKLAQHDKLQNLNEVWASNYIRAQETAYYICNRNNLKLNISSSFDERHYGDIDNNGDKEMFWINQFKDCNLKYKNGESQNDVRSRFENKLTDIIRNKDNKRIAIVAHNACILFYILGFCKLEKAECPKKLTISFNNTKIIEDSIMESPSIIEIQLEGKNVVKTEYHSID